MYTIATVLQWEHINTYIYTVWAYIVYVHIFTYLSIQDHITAILSSDFLNCVLLDFCVCLCAFAQYVCVYVQ